MNRLLISVLIGTVVAGSYLLYNKLKANNGDTSTSTSTSSPTATTSSSPEETKPKAYITIDGKQYYMPWQAAQLSTVLSITFADRPDPDEDEKEPDMEFFAPDFLNADALKLFVESLNTLATIKKDNSEYNTTQILNDFLKKNIINEKNYIILARAADFYDVPPLLQALARFYIKDDYPIKNIDTKSFGSLIGPGQFTFAKEVYRQYWLTKKKVPAIEGNFFKAVANEFGVSIQELLDNNWELTNDLSKKHINSLDGLLNIKNIKTLTDLDLSDNKLQTLPEGVFTGLSALTLLGISDNKLQTLPEGIFTGLSSLKLL